MKTKQLSMLLSAEFYGLLKEIAELDDRTVSQVVRELLESLEPGLRQARDMMLAARDLNEAARKTMLPEIERHGKQIESNLKYGLENIEKMLKDSDK